MIRDSCTRLTYRFKLGSCMSTSQSVRSVETFWRFISVPDDAGKSVSCSQTVAQSPTSSLCWCRLVSTRFRRLYMGTRSRHGYAIQVSLFPVFQPAHLSGAVKFSLSETLCAFVRMFYYLHAISQLWQVGFLVMQLYSDSSRCAFRGICVWCMSQCLLYTPV